MKRFALLLAVALCALTATSAAAQSDIGFKNVGIAVGYVSPENLDGVFGIGGFADLGTVAPNIGLEARLDYWGWSETNFGIETGVRDVTFPAPLKQLFAQVVEARQAAQAALERARGETAVLRHLANTARLLEGNPALVTLRTLDAAASARGTIVLGVSPSAALAAAAEPPRRPERE